MFNSKAPTVFAAVIVAAIAADTANAARVLFVDSDAALHPSWQALIEGGGHTFTRYAGDYNPNTVAERDDIVNNHDVIVMSGSNPAFNSVRAHGANWNSLPTPMLDTGMYLTAGLFGAASWNWLDSGSGDVPGGAQNIDPWNVGDASDLIWTGITLGAGPTVGDLYDGGMRFFDLNGNSLKSGITALAINPGDSDQITLAYGEPGALRPGGGAQYYYGGLTGGGGQAEPFTALGEQVFLNAIGVLSGEITAEEPAPATPEPATMGLGLLALGGLLARRRRA